MERLTKKKEDRYFEGEEFWTSAEEPDEDEIDRVYFKLADYEDIGTVEEFAKLKAENAKLTEQLKNAVVLPCKVGDTVYVPYSTVQGKWEGVRRGLIRHIGKSKNYDWGINIDFELSFTESFYYPQLIMLHLVSSLNKTWFKTKPEAEARLKEILEEII